MSKPQLRLQLDLPAADHYRTWVRHPGVEDACNRLALWSVHGGRLWLTSDHAAGKSHLLHSFTTDFSGAALLSIQAESEACDAWRLVRRWMQKLDSRPRWLIDAPAGQMPAAQAQALFHIIERARDLQRPLALAWRGAPEQLPPELSSRLLAMEHVEMRQPESDAALLEILGTSAERMQWDIREQVLQAMMHYLPRDLEVLVPALRTLESRSFEQQHRPGPAWVKQQLTKIASEQHPKLL